MTVLVYLRKCVSMRESESEREREREREREIMSMKLRAYQIIWTETECLSVRET